MKLRVPLTGPRAGERELDRDAAKYVTRVRRMGVGDEIVVFDPEEVIEADARIVEAGRKVVVSIGEVRPASLRPARRVTLLQGAAKGDKIDAVIRDATELGASRVVPVVCERSVARPPADRAKRWRRIAVEAARQCGRGDAPVVEAVMPLAEALERIAGTSGIALHPLAPRGFDDVLQALRAKEEIAILVGPEGGLTPGELARAEQVGLVPSTLGPLVLRTETVCAVALGAVMLLRVR